MFFARIFRTFAIAALAAQAIGPCAAPGDDDLPSSSTVNDYYTGNRAPLISSGMIKLPPGYIRPQGWLLKQIELQAAGFCGNMEAISQWCDFTKSAWASPGGEGQFGGEELPYWLRGYTDLAFILDDPRMIANAKKWIDAILSSQGEDGFFGPRENAGKPDLWPNMVALCALRSYQEATGDPRIIPFMTKYFNWVNALPRQQLLSDERQRLNGGDQLDSIYWLYNRTGERWLLDLAAKNHERTADWSGNIPTMHGASLANGFSEPAQFHQQSHKPEDLQASARTYNSIMRKYGQVPGGMFGADESARQGFSGPRQCAETCSIVEMMHSHEQLLKITGEPVWADRWEEVAFNSLPSSMTPDLKGVHSLTGPNQIQLDRTNKAPMIGKEGDAFSYSPHASACCQHNVSSGWPDFAEHIWMATPGNGLAAAMYAPSVVVAKVGSLGRNVRITQFTDYPFSDTVKFTIGLTNRVRFPLRFRIPSWCASPEATLNNLPARLMFASEGWATIDRIWRDGDHIELKFPMDTRVRTWGMTREALSVSRGPLWFSLQIRERWEQFGETEQWPGFEVFPDSPWNYALDAASLDPDTGFRVERPSVGAATQPFSLEGAPLVLKANARRLRRWQQEANGLIGEIPFDKSTTEPLEAVTLVPMGAARLRVTVFPKASSEPPHDPGIVR